MHNILQEIITEKYKEVQKLKNEFPHIHCVASTQANQKNFKAAIAVEGLTFIGEIKRKSPSKGQLSKIPEPLHLLEEYVQGGVSAVSVLTDKKYFSGSLDDLNMVTLRLKDRAIPITYRRT